MKIGRQDRHSSAISTSNEETIVVRGRDLARELIGSISFTEHFWLLVTGAMPDAAQRRVLDATLVAIAEHGLVPSVQAARLTYAAAPEALQGAVAAGILGCGSVVLGSSEAAGIFLASIASRIDTGESMTDAAQTIVREYRSARRSIPGYGHPLHKKLDPRVQRLFEIALRPVVGRHVQIACEVESLPPDLVGKRLALNVPGARCRSMRGTRRRAQRHSYPGAHRRPDAHLSRNSSRASAARRMPPHRRLNEGSLPAGFSEVTAGGRDPLAASGRSRERSSPTPANDARRSRGGCQDRSPEGDDPYRAY